MKSNGYIWLLVIINSVSILLLNVKSCERETTAPEPINYELYEYKFDQLQSQLDTLQNQFNSISHEITKDSIIIVNAPRSKRDSIRAVVNPR